MGTHAHAAWRLVDLLGSAGSAERGESARQVQEALRAGSLRPVALAAGDFDEDGVADLVCAFTGNGTGRLALLRGNEDSLFPGQAAALGRMPDPDGGYPPFHPHILSYALSGPVDLLASGDIDGDGHSDIVSAGRGENELLVLSGDGRGGLRPARSVKLAGEPTALAIGDVGRRDGRAEILVAVHDPGGDRLLLFAGLEGETPRPSAQSVLPAEVTRLSVGLLDPDSFVDVAVTAREGSFLIRGRDISSGAEARAPGGGDRPALIPLSAERGGVAALDEQGDGRGQVLFVGPSIAIPAAGATFADLPEVGRLLDLERSPSAALPMLLNGDGIVDLVILGGGSVQAALSAPLATFTVNSVNDVNDGLCNPTHCSLREAILAANASAGADLIAFSIGSGPATITLSTDLPTITGTVTIDGTSQPGFLGAPIVEVHGAYGAVFTVLRIEASDCLISHLVINNAMIGIWIVAGNSTQVQGNYIGTDLSGGFAVGNDDGIEIPGGCCHVIGGTSASARNVVSGNFNRGVYVSSSSTRVLGNYIGTDASGQSPLGNAGEGVAVSGFATIGEKLAGAGNVVSGNLGNGIKAFSGPLIQGNRIGTNASGLGALGNGGSGVFGERVTIGGTGTGAGNVISANSVHGIDVGLVGSVHIEGNLIGTAATGSAPLGNGADGIHFEPSANGTTVGGSPGARNVVAFNGGRGIGVEPGSRQNAFLFNSIFANEGIGIDLGVDGVTMNDPGDADSGANDLQNYPELLSAVTGSSGITIEGILNATAATAYTVEVFFSPTCDPASGFGEGKTSLGALSVATDTGGHVAFSTTLPTPVPPGSFLTATATDPDNNTSEFSKCLPVSGGARLAYGNSIVSEQCAGGGPGSSDGVFDPGETGTLQAFAANEGTETATNVSATLLSTTPGITIIHGSATFPAITAGATVSSDPPHFSFGVDTAVPCGTPIHFTLLFVADQGSWSESFTLPVGSISGGGVTVHPSTDVPMGIRDFSTTISQLVIAEAALIQDIDVTVTLTHTYDNDLTLTLVPPLGPAVQLSYHNGGSGDDYTETTFDDETALSITAGSAPFVGAFRPQQPLSALDGLSPAGIWLLQITDDAAQDTGTLLAWSLTLTTQSASICTACSVPPAGEVPLLEWTAGSGTNLQWLPAPGAFWYNLYQGGKSDLPNLLNAVPDSCRRHFGTGLATGDVLTETPPAGALHWYLAVAGNTAGAGPSGDATTGPRLLDSVGSCP